MGKPNNVERMLNAPLPMRNGVAPSRVYLPPGKWPTLLDFLSERFKYIAPEILLERLVRGEIVDDAGAAQKADGTYKPQRWLWYYREVPNEPVVPFELTVLHQDERLVVADKPHFLASIPGGRYLRETALTRLRSLLGLPLLTPVHRLDRDTAGVMLFCADPSARGAYQTLFQSRNVQKEYEAIAPWHSGLDLPRVHRSCIHTKSTHFTMFEAEGEPNSETVIELIGQWGHLGHYRLRPHTGRKHQLRVHMSALGIPICNDGFYPELLEYQADDDFTRPLQLLARAVEFKDPFTGKVRRFESQRQLEFLASK
ncbi:MAG TPA: pseudouridine synthase [Eoetvoesiella sp.]